MTQLYGMFRFSKNLVLKTFFEFLPILATVTKLKVREAARVLVDISEYLCAWKPVCPACVRMQSGHWNGEI
jgi:hypothetical protein